MNPRVVVTGVRSGKSVVVSDESRPVLDIPLMPGSSYIPVWGTDGLVELPSSGVMEASKNYFPPPGGFRFAFFTLGPGTLTLPEDFDVPAAVAQISEQIPGLLDVMEPDAPGMHTSDTIDVDYVLSGDVTVELDDGTEVDLHAGDTIVQNGNRHAWRNRSDQPCVLVVAIVGASRTS